MRPTRIHRSSYFATGLALSALAFGCGGSSGAEPGDVQGQISAHIPGLFDAAKDGADQAAGSTALAGLTDSLASIDSLGMPFQLAPGTTDDGTALRTFSLEDGDPTGDEIAQWLNDNIFTDANYVGDGQYRIPADLVCADPETGAVDPECADMWNQVDVRIHAELAGDGIDFTLLIGPNDAAPLLVEVRSDRLTLAVDLGGAAAAVDHVASVTGESADLPEVLEGVVALTLRIPSENAVSFELAVREAIAIEVAGASPMSFSTAAKDPLAQLLIDGVEREIVASFDLGRTTLSMPWSEWDWTSLATGTMNLDWQGLSFTAVVADGSNQIAIGNIGLGDGTSTLSLDDTALVSIDLNADSGRRFDLTLSPDPAGGLPIASFDPGMDLTVDVFMQPLADAGDFVDPWLLDDTYRFAIEGDQPATQSIAGDANLGTPGALRVQSGTMTVSSTTDSVVVNAGQCLVADTVESGENPVVGAVAAGACPE